MEGIAAAVAASLWRAADDCHISRLDRSNQMPDRHQSVDLAADSVTRCMVLMVYRHGSIHHGYIDCTPQLHSGHWLLSMAHPGRPVARSSSDTASVTEMADEVI